MSSEKKIKILVQESDEEDDNGDVDNARWRWSLSNN